MKYYRSTQGKQYTKWNLLDYISDTAIIAKDHNRKIQGLTLPKKVIDNFKDIDLEKKHIKWVLGYHDLNKYNFICLFPYKCELDRNTYSEVEIPDLPKRISNVSNRKNFDFDFKANKIYIWPELITITSDGKSTGGYVFEVPEIFLKPSIYEVKDFQFRAQVIEEEEKEMKDPERLFFSLFYDVHGNLIYFKNHFVKQLKPIIPDFLFDPEGCVWSKGKELMKNSLSTLKDRNNPDKWVSG